MCIEHLHEWLECEGDSDISMQCGLHQLRAGPSAFVDGVDAIMQKSTISSASLVATLFEKKEIALALISLEATNVLNTTNVYVLS